MPKVNYRPRSCVNGAASVFNETTVPFLESSIACGQPHMYKDMSVFCHPPLLITQKDTAQRIYLVLPYNQCTSFFMPYNLIAVIF